MKPLTLAGIVGVWMLIGAAGWLVMAVESNESDDELPVNTARRGGGLQKNTLKPPYSR